MMVWEGSKDPMVNLCNEFRKAVVASFQAEPELGQKILGTFTHEELQTFDHWSKAAVEKSKLLKEQLEKFGYYDDATATELDKIVLDMSEKSAECALRVLGKQELQAFVKPENRTEALSAQYKKRNYPYLACIFAP